MTNATEIKNRIIEISVERIELAARLDTLKKSCGGYDVHAAAHQIIDRDCDLCAALRTWLVENGVPRSVALQVASPAVNKAAVREAIRALDAMAAGGE